MTSLAIVPVDAQPPDVLDALQAALEMNLGVSARRAAGIDAPPSAFDPARGQWSAVTMLQALVAESPDAERVLGVTGRDLFIPVLSFVYGQAQLRGRASVVSLARLQPEFYGLRPEPELLRIRAAKEAVHEVGHSFGLVHCLDRGCAMALSVGLEDLDRKTASLCPSCLALLRGSSLPRLRPEPSLSTGGSP